jgi:hypothetical protein
MTDPRIEASKELGVIFKDEEIEDCPWILVKDSNNKFHIATPEEINYHLKVFSDCYGNGLSVTTYGPFLKLEDDHDWSAILIRAGYWLIPISVKDWALLSESEYDELCLEGGLEYMNITTIKCSVKKPNLAYVLSIIKLHKEDHEAFNLGMELLR